MCLPIKDEDLRLPLGAHCKLGQSAQCLLLADKGLALAVAHLYVGQRLTGERVQSSLLLNLPSLLDGVAHNAKIGFAKLLQVGLVLGARRVQPDALCPLQPLMLVHLRGRERGKNLQKK